MMSRSRARGLLATIALAAAAVLAGCAGIPTSGPVVAGPEIGFAEPDFVVNPAGPQPGATPADILVGFMTALRAPQGGYQVAKEFLAPSLATSWKPDARALIRVGTPGITETLATPTTVRVDYTIETVAQVDDRGRYAETPRTERTLAFAFSLHDGEWRISEAPDGIVLSAAAFDLSFQPTALYFLDPNGRFLVPDPRWFARRSTTPVTIVEELLRGPTEWLQRVVVTGFPAGTTLGDQSVDVRTGGTVRVDLNAAAAATSPEARAAMRVQLAATLGVPSVELSAAGVPLEIPPNPGLAPLLDPQPSGAVLVGTGGDFGFGTDQGIVPIAGITPAVVADEATGAVLAHDLSSAAYRDGDGAIRVVSVADPVSRVIDDRDALLPPSLDPVGFVWTAQGIAGAAITAVALDGTVTPLSTDGLPGDFAIVSLAVSRDGTRLLVAGSSALGTRLLVYGIVRVDGIPVELTGPLELPVPVDVLDAAWVDDRTVVALGRVEGAALLVPLGGPSVEFGVIDGAVAIVGGPGGASGIRALAQGTVLAPDTVGDWNPTGTDATFLGVQQ